MKILTDNNPIIACSTGSLTNSAIGIIRISGRNYFNEVNKFFSIDLNSLKPRYATFCSIIYDGKVYDEIVLTYFKGPNSYNGEDILELGVHGNQINIQEIIDLFISFSSLRKAEPGEFSYRAYKNKKMNLSQVEGLDLLLNASTIFELEQGQSLLGGQLKEGFENLLEKFKKHKSAIEFGFDFLEDMGEERFNQEFSESFNELKSAIGKLHSKVINQGNSLINPEVTLYGLPNSGKSSLFNNLLGEDRAIVSDIQGTTRDYIKETFFVRKNQFKLIDTAGIRSTGDVIEEMGIEKSLEITKNSFFKILVVNPFNFNSEYFFKVKEVEFDLIIFTHKDLEGFEEAYNEVYENIIKVFGPIEPTKTGPIEPTKTDPIEPTKTGPIEPTKTGPIEPTKTGPIEPTKTGPIEPTKTGPIEPTKTGPMEPIILDLTDWSDSSREDIFNMVDLKYMKLLDFDPVLLERHSFSIKNIYKSFSQYEEILRIEDDMGIISSELNIVGHCISELIGIISADDILNNIFDNFCIGK